MTFIWEQFDDIHLRADSSAINHLNQIEKDFLKISFKHPGANELNENYLNSSSPGQNGCHFADDIFKYIFLNENFDF